MKNEELRMKNEELRMKNEELRMKNEELRMTWILPKRGTPAQRAVRPGSGTPSETRRDQLLELNFTQPEPSPCSN